VIGTGTGDTARGNLAAVRYVLSQNFHCFVVYVPEISLAEAADFFLGWENFLEGALSVFSLSSLMAMLFHLLRAGGYGLRLGSSRGCLDRLGCLTFFWPLAESLGSFLMVMKRRMASVCLNLLSSSAGMPAGPLIGKKHIEPLH